jgi:hypothetical protein
LALSATRFGVAISDRYGTKLVEADIFNQSQVLPLKAGLTAVTLRIHSLHLNPGSYKAGLIVGSAEDVFDRLPEAFQVEVVGEKGAAPPNLFTTGGSVPAFVTSHFELVDVG